MYRQGDVLLKPVSRLPKGKKRENGILAYGEVTGHSHAIADLEAAGVFDCGEGLFLSVNAEGGVSIQHQEHGAIEVPQGNYEVVIQREYHPDEIRSVLD